MIKRKRILELVLVVISYSATPFAIQVGVTRTAIWEEEWWAIEDLNL